MSSVLCQLLQSLRKKHWVSNFLLNCLTFWHTWVSDTFLIKRILNQHWVQFFLCSPGTGRKAWDLYWNDPGQRVSQTPRSYGSPLNRIPRLEVTGSNALVTVMLPGLLPAQVVSPGSCILKSGIWEFSEHQWPPVGLKSSNWGHKKLWDTDFCPKERTVSRWACQSRLSLQSGLETAKRIVWQSEEKIRSTQSLWHRQEEKPCPELWCLWQRGFCPVCKLLASLFLRWPEICFPSDNATCLTHAQLDHCVSVPIYWALPRAWALLDSQASRNTQEKSFTNSFKQSKQVTTSVCLFHSESSKTG